MKRQHLTLLTAVALLLAVAFVVLRTLKGPGDDRHPTEALEAFEKRQAERFRESKLKREASRQTMAADLSSLKKELLEEFPNLRPDPAIPNNENPIYLLNELISDLGPNMEKIRSKGIELWSGADDLSIEEAQEFLNEHKALIGKLEKIANMYAGSFSFENDEEFTGDSSSLMVFIDLLRLRTGVALATEGFDAPVNIISADSKLTDIITESEGAPMAHHLMTQPRPITPSSVKETYENLSNMGMFATAMGLTWGSPYWGQNLNSQTLIQEVRNAWWELNQPAPDPLNDSSYQDPAAIRAYAQYASATITRLNDLGLIHYLNAPPVPISSEGLSPQQFWAAKSMAGNLESYLNWVARTGLHQHQEMAAIQIREWEKNPENSEWNVRPSPLQPLTMQPYEYDPETRLLRSTLDLKGSHISPTFIHKPGEGGVWNSKFF